MIKLCFFRLRLIELIDVKVFKTYQPMEGEAEFVLLVNKINYNYLDNIEGCLLARLLDQIPAKDLSGWSLHVLFMHACIFLRFHPLTKKHAC